MIPLGRRGLIACAVVLTVASTVAPAQPRHEALPPNPGQQRPAPSSRPQVPQESPKVLGRRFPAPVAPRTPRANPKLHVAVVSPRQSSVFGRRTRSGGGRRGLGDGIAAEGTQSVPGAGMGRALK
jgi:hypothetical protein